MITKDDSKIRTVRLIMLIILIIAAIMILRYGIPGKHAVREKDVESYSDYIIVKEVHYTGTGWIKTSGAKQFHYDQGESDIELTGNLPPGFNPGMGTSINAFLCIVDYKGIVEHPAFSEGIQSYYVREWYPIYPVVRNSLIPYQLLPKNYLTIWEVRSKSY